MRSEWLDNFTISIGVDIGNIPFRNGTIPTSSPMSGVAILVFVITGVLGLVALPLNGVIIFLVVTRKQLHQEQYILLSSLALADVVLIISQTPVGMAATFINKWPLGKVGCQITGFLCSFSIFASFINMANIAIIRLICVVYTNLYRKLCRKKLTCITLILVWLESVILAVPPFFGWGNYMFVRKFVLCTIDFSSSASYTAFCLILGGMIPQIIIVLCHIIIFIKVKQSRRRIQNMKSSSNTTVPDLRLVFQLVIIILLFLASYLPLFIFIVIDPKRKLPGVAYDIVKLFITLKSVIQPLTFFYFNRLIRSASGTLCSCLQRKKHNKNIEGHPSASVQISSRKHDK